MVSADEIVRKLQDSMPSAQVRAVDMTGGGDHWQVSIKAAEFKGKSLVEQHQMVYRALGELMSGPIHALALDTREA
jgi:stress-induced morphogen